MHLHYCVCTRFYLQEIILKSIKSINIGLTNLDKPKHVALTYSSSGQLIALKWKFDESDPDFIKLRNKVKKHAVFRWPMGWVFAESTKAQKFYESIVSEHPDWLVIGDPTKPFLPLSGAHVSCIEVGNGLKACLFPNPLPPFAQIDDHDSYRHLFRVVSGGKDCEVGVVIDSPERISKIVGSLVSQGAVCNDILDKKWSFSSSSKVKIKVSGWIVQIECDLRNLSHYLLENLNLRDGVINITRSTWPKWKGRLQEASLEWEGDDPEAEISIPSNIDVSRVPGWNAPAPNGHLLHEYQKDGVSFCASRGMRALIGDEMGVGKTVQAIASAEAVGAPRVFIICPANARYVWEREIIEWGAQGAIQHITTQLDKLDMGARWHIATYDLIASRVEKLRLINQDEEKAFLDSFPNLADKISRPAKGQYPRSVSLDSPLDKTPSFTQPKKIEEWNNKMRRLKGELLEQITSAGPLLVILDEAHRAKNKEAKRTKAIQRIATETNQLIMLTGTPLRNNEHEAAVLLGLLDAKASQAFSSKKSYTINDVKEYLNYLMIRRTKAQVLPQLPEKTRQTVEIGNIDSLEDYQNSLDWARECYLDAITRGESEAAARQEMRGGIEQARTALGIAKVLGGEVADYILDVVENKGCCVVFCAHQKVGDLLKIQLEKQKLRVAIVDGRVQQKTRSKIVNDFQGGSLDVFIGGINAAGEAITLTRADTVVFVELDWVPSALLQAEDRIHRIGQQSNCQIIHLMARLPTNYDNMDVIMSNLIGKKIDRIGFVLDEGRSNIISGAIQNDLYAKIIEGSCLPRKSDGACDSHVQNDEKPKSSGDKCEMKKRKPGRPKVYVDKAPPTATERSKHSTAALTEAGGKRIMLRLSPEAYNALKTIMSLTGDAQETAAINNVIVEMEKELLKKSKYPDSA